MGLGLGLRLGLGLGLGLGLECESGVSSARRLRASLLSSRLMKVKGSQMPPRACTGAR